MTRRFSSAIAIAILAGGGGEQAATPPPAAPSAAPAPAAPPPAASAEAPPAAPPKVALVDLEKKAVEEWYAAFNAHDAKKLGSLYASDAVSTRPGPGGWSEPLAGQDAIAGSFTGLFTGFPDLKSAPVRIFQKHDLVVIEWAAVGTNSGEMMGGPATNKKGGIYGCDLLWFDDSGAIKKQETYHDDTTLLRQLGKMPGKAPKLALLPEKDAEWVVATGIADEDTLVDKMKSTWPATWSKHDVKGYDAVLDDDSEHVDYSVPTEFKGRAANLKELEMYSKAMPDLSITIDKAWGFAVASTVVAEFTATGTLKGNLGPLKANGKVITIHGLDIDELKDGKLEKAYTYANGMEMLAAAGVLPRPKAPKGAPADQPAVKPAK